MRRTSPRKVVWMSSDPPGVEICTLESLEAGSTLSGSVIRREKTGLAMITYLLETDRAWKTKKASIEQTLGGETRAIVLEATSKGWLLDGRMVRRLDGCVDVDIQASPSTNSLPLKRAKREKQKVGSRLELTAAWVRFPSLRVQPLKQSYERISRTKWVYRNGGFRSVIELDAFGLVRRYGNYWTAV